MNKQFASAILVFVLFVGSLFPRSFAQDLILEIDPDEPLSSYDTLIEDSSFLQEYETEVDALRHGYLQGYQELFVENDQLLQGVESLLIPLEEDISEIQVQLQALQLQRERLLLQQQVTLQQSLQLEDLSEKMSIQQELVRLEYLDARQQLEGLLLSFLERQIYYVGEFEELKLLRIFSQYERPSELIFQHYLSEKIREHLLTVMQEVLQKRLQIELLQSQVDLSLQRLEEVTTQQGLQGKALAEQASYQQSVLASASEEQQYFQDLLREAREEQAFLEEQIITLSQNAQPFVASSLESFVWPVQPVLGVSANFQEQAYKRRFGLEHNAIDIPTDQLTPIRAPLSGRVMKVHDGGERGYSYLQLIHRDGFSTVYGHVFSFAVEEGDLVQQGQIVARSGGAIGTHGAGALTTGPHLHFELLKDGQHVDPLQYLPSQNR